MQAVKAALIGIDPGGKPDFADSMAELGLLASSAGSQPVMTMIAKRSKPDPALYMGSGKATELKEQMAANVESLRASKGWYWYARWSW